MSINLHCYKPIENVFLQKQYDGLLRTIDLEFLMRFYGNDMGIEEVFVQAFIIMMTSRRAIITVQ